MTGWYFQLYTTIYCKNKIQQIQRNNFTFIIGSKSTYSSYQDILYKNDLSGYFYGGIAENICTRDKLYKRFKLRKLHADKDISKERPIAIKRLV